MPAGRKKDVARLQTKTGKNADDTTTTLDQRGKPTPFSMLSLGYPIFSSPSLMHLAPPAGRPSASSLVTLERSKKYANANAQTQDTDTDKTHTQKQTGNTTQHTYRYRQRQPTDNTTQHTHAHTTHTHTETRARRHDNPPLPLKQKHVPSFRPPRLVRPRRLLAPVPATARAFLQTPFRGCPPC